MSNPRRNNQNNNQFRNILGTIFAFLMASGLIGTFAGWIPNPIDVITNEEPNVSWTVSPVQGDAPLKVIADTNANDPDGDTLTISWYINDDLQTEGSNTSHEFNLKIPGQYRLRALVTDNRVVKPVESIQLVTVNRPVINLESMELDRSYSLNEPEKLVKLPTRIITNGYSLSLTAYQFTGASTIIRAFKEKKASDGKDGGNGQPGATGQEGGQPGERGQNGSNGTNGARGKNSGLISINAEVIDARLTIINNAQYGGNGGIGGNGGVGGKGGRGKSSKSIIIDCPRGPGRGGKGGVGGDGGKGGDAGAGGNAGDVTIEVSTEVSTAKRLEIEALGGKAGQPGAGGIKGKGGNGGDEGIVIKPCKTKDRYGARGADGKVGSKGATAKNGVNGQISVRVGSKTYEGQNGRFMYP